MSGPVSTQINLNPANTRTSIGSVDEGAPTEPTPEAIPHNNRAAGLNLAT